jgi:diguanylate cyclase
LQTNGISASCLELEITERLLMSSHPEAKNVIERLRGLGVRLALDDFGTGYSSLSYLSRFPVDTLKIDKSFVCEVPFNASNVALVEAIIAMAHGLHLRVVAEGVETREQLDFLRKHGCDFAGIFFQRPCAGGRICQAALRLAADLGEGRVSGPARQTDQRSLTSYF